jgi:hypothetical protein
VNKGDIFASILIVAVAIGIVILAVYTAAILAPIIAIGCVVYAVYFLISSDDCSKRKCSKSKKRRL